MKNRGKHGKPLSNLNPNELDLIFVPQTTMQSFIEIDPKLRPSELRQTQTDRQIK